MICLMVFLERKTGTTGVAFGRTDLSIGGIGTAFHALSHRHGPVSPGFQGMPEKLDFHVFLFFDVFLERKSCITGVPFGRTELSIGWIGTSFHALLQRHGPVGPGFQGMPEKLDFHDLFDLLFFDSVS